MNDTGSTSKHAITKVECVGSLLVPQQDLKELSKQTDKELASSNPNGGSNSSNLVRRITEAIGKPVSKETEEEIENWMAWSG